MIFTIDSFINPFPADLSKRTRIVITDKEDARPSTISGGDQYVKWLNKKYLDKESKAIPYHYVITSGAKIYNSKNETACTDTLFFDAYRNDIIILVEGLLRGLSLAQFESLELLCINLCIKYNLSYKSISYFPYDGSSDSSTLTSREQLREAVMEGLETKGPDYIVRNSFENDPKSSDPLTSEAAFPAMTQKTTIKELSDFTGIPVNVLREQNAHLERELPISQDSSSINIIYPGDIAATTFTIKGYGPASGTNNVKNSKAVSSYYADINTVFDLMRFNNIGSSVLTQKPGINTLNISAGRKETSFATSIKPYKESVLNSFELPGYENAYFEFQNLKTGEIKLIGFMISPNSVSFSMSNDKQISKTSSGWNLKRGGKGLQSISLNGYMIDSKNCQERHDFIEEYYRECVEDKRNADGEIYNEWSASLIIEGRKYTGIFESLSMQKTSAQPFLYQYGISFLSVSDVLIYRSSEAISNKVTMSVSSAQSSSQSSGQTSTVAVGSAVAELLLM